MSTEADTRHVDQLEKRVSDGDRVKIFLDDPAVREVFRELEKQYFAEFRDAETLEKQQLVGARARALVDVATSLRAVVDRGAMAKPELERTKPRNPRGRAIG